MAKMRRREALVGGVHLTVLASAVGAQGCAGGSRVTAVPDGGTVTLRLSEIPDLAAVGGWTGLRVDGVDDELIVARVGPDDVRVVSRICGHMGCKVKLASDAASFDCPCHGSRFELDGAKIEGPSPTPLRRYETSLEGDVLRFAI